MRQSNMISHIIDLMRNFIVLQYCVLGEYGFAKSVIINIHSAILNVKFVIFSNIYWWGYELQPTAQSADVKLMHFWKNLPTSMEW